MKIFLTLLLLSQIAYAQFKNVRVDDGSAWQPNEVTIAINPLNPNILAAGSNLDYFYISYDGGNSWEQKTLTSKYGVWGDPSVIFDNNGYIYFAHLSNPPEKTGYWIDRIVVQRSIDSGKTFDTGYGIGFNSPKNQDKEWLAADLTNSPFRGNIYITWTEFDKYGSHSASDSSRILFSKSTDKGKSWSEPIVISDTSGNCVDADLTVEGAVPCVGPNGEIYVAWAGPGGIHFDKSTDGGNSFGKDVFVTEQPGGWDFAIPGIERANGLPITACDVSNSPYRGNIYICWGDQRNGTTDSDVFFIKSTDGGKTWGKTIKVNNDNSGRHQFFPWMTVDSSNGYIYVVFYDRRETTGNATDVYLARSTDGGETFENFKISESPFTPISTIFFGDYINIAAYKNIVRPIWMRLTDHELSIWTALINGDSLLNPVKERKEILPSEFVLGQNYPNPFGSKTPSHKNETVIPFTLARTSNVKISIHNILGQKVWTMASKTMNAGHHEILFEARNLPAGIYFYSLNANGRTFTKKMILLK
jgi:hypothetical protein